MGRLLTVPKDGSLVEEYQYDVNGTRSYEMNSLREIAGRSFTYSDEDHLLSAGATTYQYNLDGFLTTKTHGTDITTYDYSSCGELLSVALPDGRLIEYIHDPLGRRIGKKVDSIIIEKYLWQGLTRLLAVYDGNDNLLMRFEYADGRMPVAMTKGSSTYYLTYDQVGSLRIVADASGIVVKRVNYDSFGNIINDTDPTFEVPFGFAGGLHDRDTELVRFGYRDYDPDTGRWTAKDPIFFAGGDSDLYVYVLNDPINLVDPNGKFVITGTVVLGFLAAKALGIGTAWIGLQIATHAIGDPVLPSDNPCEDYHLSNFMNDAVVGIGVFNTGLGAGIAGAEIVGAALSNPVVAQNAIDAMQGAFQPGTPPPTPGGYVGAVGRAVFDKFFK
jgi:RHS repeat-associated protein